MANQEHVDILKQGIDVWNDWRERHPEVDPDLRKTDHKIGFFVKSINGANFSRTDLRGTSLILSDPCNVDFSNAKLQKAKLFQLSLSKVNLSGADLSGADFNGTRFYDVHFNGANLSNVNLE